MAATNVNTFIVLGMHRSGTSLIAGSLHRAGVNMGERMIPGDPSNPSGHFEDVGFVHLHEDMLKFNGADLYLQAKREWQYSGEHYERAGALLERRQKKQKLWGWKDPRTSLFVPFWQNLINTDRACFIVAIRSPEGVVNSLLRRALFSARSRATNPVARYQAGIRFNRALRKTASQFLRAWIIYNNCLEEHVLKTSLNHTMVTFGESGSPDNINATLRKFGLAEQENIAANPAELGMKDYTADLDPELLQAAQALYMSMLQYNR